MSGTSIISIESNSQHGAGMIEVLVALLVMSIGILGYAGLQLRALDSANQSHFRTQAAAIAQSVVERISVNPGATARALYQSPGGWDQSDMTKSKPSGWDTCINAVCTQAQIAAWDILQSRWLAWSLLPNGHVSTTACDSLTCVVVAWNDATPAACDPSIDDCVMLEVLP
jgi:type IV pilus assembly protein PilV|tara:strand:- start:16124 stop:16633 length:510 start_codon:yes stop_codon:yes gene_type:complete